ncbi:hypothetical protein [Acanthopleuribacter pedis]|uniref:Replication-relaxation n=1 Tax=Acanthopleuribacter pedis TaxID=442870 RepID=A0A8J7Q0S1_9BACT|nr:hypothetical protein [Acanthopleuribacter pedis]MBO1318292.1 hypothetical protein [Acanthopleuribacter pedis]
MIHLTERQLRVLRTLNRYGYLTNAMLYEMLGISTCLREVERCTAKLARLRWKKQPLILPLKFSVDARFGRLSYMYCLTTAGQEVLREEDTGNSIEALSAKYPKFAKRDYFHRQLTVRAHIAFDQMLEQRYRVLSLRRWERYFVKTGNNRQSSGAQLRAQTRLELPGTDRYCIPDVICEVTDTRPDRTKSMWFLWEVALGHDTLRNLKHLGRYRECLQNKSLATAYGHQQGATILLLCKEAGLASTVRQRFAEYFSRPDRFAPFVLVTHADDFFRDPETCWRAPRPLSQSDHYSVLNLKPKPFPLPPS